MQTLESAREQHESARLQLETIRYQTEAELIRKMNRPLLEHYDVPPDPWRYRDPVDPAHTTTRRRTTRTLRRDRSNGNYYPFYENETDLAVMRADARDLQAYFPRIVGALEQLGNYVLGDGMTYTVQGRIGHSISEDLISRAQAVIDRFVDQNDFNGMLDREIDERSRTDGESFLGLHDRKHGIDIEIYEPDTVTEPANKNAINDFVGVNFEPCWKYGILHNKMSSRPLGYHFVFDDRGRDHAFMAASHVEHIKRNSIRSAKRGVTDFFSNGTDAKDENKLRNSTAKGATVQASIAFIREHVQGASNDGISSFVSSNATADYNRETEGREFSYNKNVKVEGIRPGTVKDIPFGMKYHAGPLGTLRSPVYIEVGQYVLRSLGSRWSMPEYMISSDASNANFASTLVAESPFVKARERDQGFYRRHFRNLLWKVLKIAWGRGELGQWDWREIELWLEINVTAPEVASRDKQQQASMNEILQRIGVKSRRTIAAEHELDFDEELKNMSEDKDPNPQPVGGLMAALAEADITDNPQEARSILRSLSESYP